MLSIFSSRKLHLNDYFRIAKTVALFVYTTGLVFYILVRLLSPQLPASVVEEWQIIKAILLIGFVTTLAVIMLLFLIEIFQQLFNKDYTHLSLVKYITIVTGLSLLFYLSGCDVKKTGIHKDLNTGMVTTYQSLEPANSLLVMNNEVLNHTDIPLGENFVLINDNVKGLKEKDGKVSAGCELVISDKQGKKIMDEPDLFKGDDVFLKEKVKALKCTISTGQPMNWEENYDVYVKFWDKYGDGKIENKFTIRMIDIP
mgnify:CR=1 FL=1